MDRLIVLAKQIQRTLKIIIRNEIWLHIPKYIAFHNTYCNV